MLEYKRSRRWARQMPGLIHLSKTKHIIAEINMYMLHELCVQDKVDNVLGYEPEDISYCCGRNTDVEGEFLGPVDKYYNVDRGGKATIHSPGQIVMYPIINLHKHDLTIDRFIYSLEQAAIDFLAREFSINAHRSGLNRGCFVGGRKICFIGTRVKQGATLYGLALNICNDLSLFRNIIPCGLSGVDVTSVQRESGMSDFDMDGLVERVYGCFVDIMFAL